MSKIINILLVFCCFFLFEGAKAQLVDVDVEHLDTLFVFKSLEAAKEVHPDSIYALRISKRKLKEFPKEILLYRNLQKLIIEKSSIKDIPTEISKLKNLKELSIRKSKLDYFPRSICKLTKLHRLDLSENIFQVIPTQIEELKELSYLNVSYNNLSVYPIQLGYLKKLKTFEAVGMILSMEEFQRIESIFQENKEVKIMTNPPCHCTF